MNTLYPWKVFLTIAEHKNFSRAALELNVSQSAVSHVISKMELEYGIHLFSRNRNGVELTGDGEKLIPIAKHMIASSDALEQELMNIQNINSGIVRVAGFNSACSMWLPDILKNFKNKYPNIEVLVFQHGDGKIRQMIDDREIDLAILSEDSAHNVDFTPLHHTPLVCLAPKDFVPLNGKSVTAQDLNGETLILQAQGYDTEIIRFLIDNNVQIKNHFRIEVDATCHQYVECGMGLCITPQMAFDCNPKDVRVWPLVPEIVRSIGLVTVFPDFITPSAQLLKNEILDYVKRLNE